MSSLNTMEAKKLESKMPPPAPTKPKRDFESRPDVNKESNAITTTDNQPSSIVVPLQDVNPGFLKEFRSFAPIPPFSGPRDFKRKLDATSLEGSNIPTKITNVFTQRRIFSKHQLPISQWPLFNSYVATAADMRSTISTSTKVDETPQRTKQEDILDYVYDWAAWAAEIPDPARRSEVLESVMRTLERVLKSGMERTAMVLGPNDVKGTKSGMRKTLQGELNIQVIITSNVKETAGQPLKEFAGQKTKGNLTKHRHAETGAAALVPSEPAAELLMSIKQASRASLTKGKRAVNEMDAPDVVQDVKRQKAENIDTGGEAKAKTVNPIDGQTEGHRGRQDKSPSPPTSPTTSAGEEKRARYRQQIFQSRLNHILKKAGKVQTRGKCTKWETVLTRLKEAGVSVKWRNMMFRDFHSGYEAWNGDGNIDPNEVLAHYAEHGCEGVMDTASGAKANKTEGDAVEHVAETNSLDTAALLSELEALPTLSMEVPIPDAFVPAQPLVQPVQPVEPSSLGVDAMTPTKLVVTLRTLPHFDPEDYSAYGVYQYENFMFSFKPNSAVKERVLISDPLISQVDTKLDAAIDDGSQLLDGRRQFIRNERGRIVATGNFVDLRSDYMVKKGLADPQDLWTWKGKHLEVDWRYSPSAMARPKAAGETLAVRVED